MVQRIHNAFVHVFFAAGLLASPAVNAQTCPTGSPPSIRYSSPACDPSGSPCPANTPISFSLVDSSGAPFALQSCETGITWDFDDGTSATGLTATHSFPVNHLYDVRAHIGSPASSDAYPGGRTAVLIANGAITVSTPKTIVHENDGSFVLNFHTTYAPASVSYSISGDSIVGSRIANASGTVSFAAGETDKTLTVPLVNDNVYEGPGSIGCGFSNPTGGVVLRDQDGYLYPSGGVYREITLVDDDPPPMLSFSSTNYVFSSANEAFVTVNRTGDMNGTVKVDYDVTPGNQMGTITFAPHVASQTIAIQFSTGPGAPTTPTFVVTMLTATGGAIFGDGKTYQPNLSAVVNIRFGPTMYGTLLIAGTSGAMSITLGNPPSADETVTLTSSRPEIVRVPASFVARSGASILNFDVEALSPGNSIITATLPASLGGFTLAAYVQVAAQLEPGVSAKKRAVHH